jgi:GAF domain-containing protein
MLALPLIYDDFVLGVLFAHTTSPRYFNEHDINLWSAFASQAATALKSAQEEERYIRDYTRLANELGKLNEKMNLENTMIRLATAGKTIFESDTCRLALVDPATGSVEGWEWAEGDMVEFRHESQPRSDGVTNYVLQTGESVFRSVGDKDKPQPVSELVAKGLKSFASLPLVYSGRNIGVLHCNYLTRQQPFDQHLRTLMEAFGARAAMALDRARRDRISGIWRELDHQTITGEDYKTSYQIFMEKLHAVSHPAFSELYFYKPATSAGKLVPAGMETVFMGNRPTLWRFSENGFRKQLIREIEQTNGGLLIVNDLESPKGSPYGNYVKKEEIRAIIAVRLDVILKEQPDSGMAGLLVMGFQKPTNFELDDLVELQYAGNFIAANILRRHLQLALQNAAEQRNQQLRSVVSIFREFVRYGRTLRLDFIAERSIEILGIDTCSLLEYDQKKGAFIQRGTAGNRYPEVPYSLPEDKFKIRFVDAKEPLEIVDVRSDELTRDSKYVEREEIKKVIVFPLRVEEKFLGLFFANYREASPLSSDATEAIGLFANLAALVLHESQLGATLTETEQRLTRRVFLDKVSLIEAAWRHTLIQKASAIRNHVFFLQKYIKRHAGQFPGESPVHTAVADIDRIAAKILDAPPRVPQSFEAEEYVLLVPVLNEVVEQIGDQTTLNSDSSIEIVVDIDALNGIQVVGHAGRLSYALEALLQNSYKAMPSGGKIVISGTRNGEWVEIRIQDTGEGVPVEIQSTLYKVVLTKEQETTGMGIGGVLAATIVEDHKGSITLERPGPGDTTVLVRFPIAQEALQ